MLENEKKECESELKKYIQGLPEYVLDDAMDIINSFVSKEYESYSDLVNAKEIAISNITDCYTFAILTKELIG